MQNYELLFILPGTMAESETAPIVDKVKELIARNHGESIEIEAMDKKRLAYPMKHIRYGYFYLVFFKAELKDAHQMRSDLRLIPELLRGIIQKHDEANTIRQIDFGTNFGENVPVVQTQTVVAEEPVVSFEKEQPKPVVDMVKVDMVKEENTHETLTPVEVSTKEEVKVESVKEEPKVEPKTRKTTKKAPVNLEDIDKKLDEILDIDLSNV